MAAVQSAGCALGEEEARDALLKEGEEARVAGCWSRCQELARKVLQSSPVCGKAWYLLCGSLCNQREFQAAEQECFRALSVRELSSEVRSAVADLMHTARLFARLQSQSEPAGNLLRNGWYNKRLQELFEAGSLQRSQGRGCKLVLLSTFWYQSTGVHGACFFKEGVRCHLQEAEESEHAFPAWRPQPAPADIVRASPKLGVLHSSARVPAALHVRLKALLDELARQRQDFPVPQYHNIIDPNLYVTDGQTLPSYENGWQSLPCTYWIPTDFEILERPEAITCLVVNKACENATGVPLPFGLGHRIVREAGKSKELEARMLTPIPGLHSAKHHKLHLSIERLLTCALPMLAMLRKPALLLPGPLQVVVKAQRIELAAGETYAGVWHEDGMEEHVVAVILYYYRASSTLEGGGLEFAGKSVPGAKTEEWFDDGELRKMQTCKVSVEEGTMVVFSNYELVHRVLRTEARTEPGSRDFVALFVIDQRKPLPDARASLCDLPGRWPDGSRDREGFVLDHETRHSVRMERLSKQVVPRKRWGIHGGACGGNAPLYWLEWMGAATVKRDMEGDDDKEAQEAVQAQLYTTPQLGRGLSGLLSPSCPEDFARYSPSWQASPLPASDAPHAPSFLEEEAMGEEEYRLEW